MVRYMFGSQVVTDWTQRGTIVSEGEYEGKKYEDRGEMLEMEPEHRLKVTHFRRMSGREDVPKNHPYRPVRL